MTDINDRAAIVELAGLLGIAAHYTDAFGHRHEISNETLLALIGAFGLSFDPAVARRELAEPQSSAPLGLGPVHLVHAKATHPELALRLPAWCRDIVWECGLDNGEGRSGRLVAPSAGTERGFAMPLPTGLPLGYPQLDLKAADVSARLPLIVAPACCYLPKDLAGEARSWGLTCQLYGLRSTRNWGMGDFTDLARVAGGSGSCGGETCGIKRLHCLVAAQPAECSSC